MSGSDDSAGRMIYRRNSGEQTHGNRRQRASNQRCNGGWRGPWLGESIDSDSSRQSAASGDANVDQRGWEGSPGRRRPAGHTRDPRDALNTCRRQRSAEWAHRTNVDWDGGNYAHSRSSQRKPCSRDDKWRRHGHGGRDPGDCWGPSREDRCWGYSHVHQPCQQQAWEGGDNEGYGEEKWEHLRCQAGSGRGDHGA